MLKIRLQRVGRKNDPSFRVVCVDSRKGPRAGKHTELLGSYDPKRDYITVKGERIKHWISNGAQVSDTVHNLLVKEGVIKAKKIHVAKEKKKETKEEEKPKEESGAETETKEEVKTEAEAPKEEAKEPEPEAPKEETPAEESKEQEVAPEKKEVV